MTPLHNVLPFPRLARTHRYYYWFGFPAFAISPPPLASPPAEISSVFDEAQLIGLRQGFATLASASATAPPHLPRAPAFFAVRLVSPGGAVEVGALRQFAEWRAAEAHGSGEALLAFCDPCPLPTHPGWPLRNLLALVGATMLQPNKTGEAVRLRVVCYREPPLGTSASLTTSADPGGSQTARSIVLRVTLPPRAATDAAAVAAAPPAKAVGWERNSAGKLGARLMDLSAQMRPEALAEASVDLNLRLMRWRLMPSLQTEKVAGTRCLLMGAGTLGCAVARCLLGWGVRIITFVDSGVVSYSNPVRQTLFTFEDCVSGNTPKAQAAADALKRIFPSVQATAHRIAIPMPGHAVGTEEVASVAADCQALSQLVQEHDVSTWRIRSHSPNSASRLPIRLPASALPSRRPGSLGPQPSFYPGFAHGSERAFKDDSRLQTPTHTPRPCSCAQVVFLLTDTRESRWLPSMLAATHGKLVINAALGFDSLLVMRHGVPGGTCSDRLGCYFCNDVVAPANSMLRRTLDQQCTVSRPGLSMVASALAVELMVTLLHHPEGANADADLGGDSVTAAAASPLGSVPHQIRASLPSFRNDAMTGRAFDKCTACSSTVLAAFRERGFTFLLEAFNRATYLEDLTGLTQMHAETEAALEDVTLFDDDDED